MGTVMKEVHALPGTTFSNIKERQSYDSDGSAMMTFLEFEKWLVTFITKVYHRRKHSALGMSPEANGKKEFLGMQPNKVQDILQDLLILKVSLLIFCQHMRVQSNEMELILMV